MKVIIGPYVGNFEFEFIAFRPWVRWLCEAWKEVCEKNDIYLSTHYNRMFLYDWLDENNILEFDRSISHTTKKKYLNEEVDGKRFLELTKEIKTKVAEINDIKRKDVKCVNLGYVKYPSIPYHKRIFSPIKVDKDESEVIFIDSGRNFDQVKDYFKNNNIKYSIYHHKALENEINIYDIVKKVSNARLLVCPIGIWTTLGNIQQIPVFSWGKYGISQYTKDGMYHFNNKKCFVIASSMENQKSIVSGIDFYMMRFNG
jgi:hypothetical protein